MSTDLATIQRELTKLQKRPLTIITLSSPITNAEPRRASTESRAPSSDSAPSPASLASDLVHYRELFKKLHFNYLEQVSKEKFLRAIVGDPPQVVESAENAALERELARVKVELKTQKEDVAGLVGDLEAQGRELAARYESVHLQTRRLRELPGEIEGLEARIGELEREQRERRGEEEGLDPRLAMPLQATVEALQERRAEVEKLDREIERLRQGAPQRSRQIERLEAELRPLESQRNGAVGAAEEARRRKEMREAGYSDEVELKGRWYTGANGVLKDMLGVEAT